MQLSILIPSIPERSGKLTKLLSKLERQKADIQPIEELGEVEFVTVVTPPQSEGGESIGQKRQMCLDKAKGEYVCFLDDDDDIAPDYLRSLLKGCKEGADVVTFRALVFLDNYIGEVEMGLGYDNEQMKAEGVTYRPPWHICPHKRELAGTFPDSSYGEDWKYMEQVQLKTEHFINKLLFIYRHSLTKSRADNELLAEQRAADNT